MITYRLPFFAKIAAFVAVTALNQPAIAEKLEVSENFGDIILKDGTTQRRLIVPKTLNKAARFSIRLKRTESEEQDLLEDLKKEPTPQDRVAARRVMYRANQAFFKGEFEKAWELVEEAERLDPEFYRIKSMKGSLLYKIGSKDLAAQLWRESLEKNPKQPEIRAMLEKTEKEL